MSTTYELPAKRPNEEEIGSDSGKGSREEASKKAKTEPGSDRDGPHFRRFDECLEYFGGDYLNAGNYWQEYKDKLRKKCKLLDLQYFQTYTRQLELDKTNRLSSSDNYLLKFGDQPWVIRPTPGCYDDYQRLFAYDPYNSPDDGFSYVYWSLESDTAFLELYDELKLNLEKSSRRSIPDIWEIVQQLSENHNIHDPFLLDSAVQDSHRWIVQEDWKKGFIPVFTKLFHETEINGRCIDEVVKDITEHDKEMPADRKRFIQPDSKGTFRILAELKKYITAKAKVNELIRRNTQGIYRWDLIGLCRWSSFGFQGKSFNDLSIEDLVRDYFREDPPNTFMVYTYSMYVKKKMQLAKKLGHKSGLEQHFQQSGDGQGAEEADEDLLD